MIRLIQTWAGAIPVGCMPKTYSPSLTKEGKKRVILDYIAANPGLYSFQIASTLGMTTGFVATNCKKLLDAGEVRREKEREGFRYWAK